LGCKHHDFAANHQLCRGRVTNLQEAGEIDFSCSKSSDLQIGIITCGSMGGTMELLVASHDIAVPIIDKAKENVEKLSKTPKTNHH